ncbi:hypothetical protein E2C01_065875 [Portunus trituberculatus]|uniref:Uncharacterized protein n=1 Tax=Portunus trituberculatus TaxID=210409 RepID=A0A5B7HNB0_PORTR|nr:hypothetical protein [Portunus trituberculatus]
MDARTRPVWEPRDLQTHGFESCPRFECRQGFLTLTNGSLVDGDFRYDVSFSLLIPVESPYGSHAFQTSGFWTPRKLQKANQPVCGSPSIQHD